MMPDYTATGTTPAQWDDVRARFKPSMMVKTELAKLAQNIDVNWPLRGKDEVPLKYIPHTIDELMMMEEIAEKPERLGLLVSILEETMAFDDPFGEMAEHVDSSSKKDDAAEKTMHTLGIPEDFPITLCALSKETLGFCEAEEITTVGGFIETSQNMAQNVVVGGDFRAFLNAFVHMDETALAAYLPLRRGVSGLHLAESIAHVITQEAPGVQAALYRRYDADVPADLRAALPKTDSDTAFAQVQDATEARLDYFTEEIAELKTALTSDGNAGERFFMHIGDPAQEKAALGLAREVLHPAPAKKGFFSRLFGK
ncbi:MAG: hypothetical protein AAGG79_02580 [Pseudomonadota bacterium]